jgi:H+-transporting ATPase
LFFLAERVFHLDRAHAQTMMYLKLSVAGHLTIFLTRTRGPFWSIRPAKILWIAVLGTQVIATLFAVYGFLMTPLGWPWALFVWAYALAWFLVNDRVKLLAYRIFDRPKSLSQAKMEAQPVAIPVAKPDADVQSKPQAAVSAAVDLTPRIAKRAYKLYEEGGRKDGAAPQNWQRAEAEIRLDLAKADPACDAKAEPEPVAKVEAKPGAIDPLQAPIKAEPLPESQDKTPSGVPPQLIKRVHAIYEEFGAQNVQRVLDWEQSTAKVRKE